MLPPSTAGLAWCKALGQKKKKPQFPSCSFVFSDKQSRLKYPFALFTVSLSSHSGFILCQLALLIDYLLGRRSNLSARILIHVEKKPHAFDNGVERETVPFFFSSPVSKVMRFLNERLLFSLGPLFMQVCDFGEQSCHHPRAAQNFPEHVSSTGWVLSRFVCDLLVWIIPHPVKQHHGVLHSSIHTCVGY